MPPLPCPVCADFTARKLDGPSELVTVDYYRCAECGHVWTTAKGDPSTVQHVTEISGRTIRRRDDPIS
jgi:uncharacterized Zn finger protein